MLVQAYLSFNGRCEEAVAFYRSALGAEVEMMMRNKDNPEPPPSDGPCAPQADTQDKIMHCSFRIGQTVVMASDGMNEGPTGFGNFALSIAADDEAQAHRFFNALAEGGQVQMPLGRTFWSPCFGMVVDRFGLCWMVGLDAPPPAA